MDNQGTELYTDIHKKDYFEKECRELLKELHQKCFLAGIPYFFCAAVENDENGTEYVADGYLTGSSGIKLKDDHIKHHLMIMDGCVAKPAREEIELSLDDFLSDGNTSMEIEYGEWEDDEER